MSRRDGLSTVRRRTLGLGLVALVVAFLGLSIAFYNKAFTPVVPVTMEADHVGNELQEHSDVKINGVIVGEVRQVKSVGDHAELSLALQPNMVGDIPSNVTAQLLPKTLFGERYVNLVPPPAASTKTISSGAVIPEDRTSTSIEVEKALADLQPVLTAVQPQKLSETLTAVSTALDGGRGKKLGETFTMLNDYLQKSNPSLPNLDHDVAQLSNVADDYNQAAPQLLHALSTLTTTSKTLVQQQQNLAMMWGDLTMTSTNLDKFLRVNKNNLIQLQSESLPTNNLLAEYAPEYPCVFNGLVGQTQRIDQSFGKGSSEPHVLHVNVQLVPTRGKYVPGKDDPQYADKRGPECFPTLKPGERAPQYPPGGPIKDGSSDPPAPNGQSAGLPLTTGAQAATGTDNSVNLVNTPEELQVVSTLVAPDMHVQPKDVPSWSTLLVGPIYRGTEVTVQ